MSTDGVCEVNVESKVQVLKRHVPIEGTVLWRTLSWDA